MRWFRIEIYRVGGFYVDFVTVHAGSAEKAVREAYKTSQIYTLSDNTEYWNFAVRDYPIGTDPALAIVFETPRTTFLLKVIEVTGGATNRSLPKGE